MFVSKKSTVTQRREFSSAEMVLLKPSAMCGGMQRMCSEKKRKGKKRLRVCYTMLQNILNAFIIKWQRATCLRREEEWTEEAVL